jgi:ornithine cyclodeaminase
LLLTRSEAGGLLDPAALMPEIREAFGAYSLGRDVPARQARSSLSGGPENSATVLFPGLVPGLPTFTVKAQAKFPAHSLLHDALSVTFRTVGTF